MLQLAFKSEAIAKRLYRSALCDKFVRYDLRELKNFTDENVISYIYRRVGLNNGITKQTGNGRFRDLDEKLAELLAATKRKSIGIHDVGVSSGITSVELFDALAGAGFDFELTVSDKYATFYEQKTGLRRDLFDADGNYQCSYLWKLYSDAETSTKYPLSCWLRAQASTFDAERAEPFLLYHPKLLRLVDSGKVRSMDYDVLAEGMPERFDCVRCMNLLNLSYFSEQQLLQGISSLDLTLNDGGLLLIGRTEQDGTNNATIYQKQQGLLSKLASVGKGSEIDRLVPQAPATIEQESALP